MGRTWKEAQRAINGNPVEFHDVLSHTVTGLSGVVSPSLIATIQGQQAPRDGLIDWITADVTPAITSGSLSFGVYNAGTVIASGDLTSGRRMSRMFHYQGSNAGEPKAIASGSVTHIEYKVGTALGDNGVTARALNVRVGLRYRD
jgi:hypothetical protein